MNWVIYLWVSYNMAYMFGSPRKSAKFCGSEARHCHHLFNIVGSTIFFDVLVRSWASLEWRCKLHLFPCFFQALAKNLLLWSFFIFNEVDSFLFLLFSGKLDFAWFWRWFWRRFWLRFRGISATIYEFGLPFHCRVLTEIVEFFHAWFCQNLVDNWLLSRINLFIFLWRFVWFCF